MSADKVSDEVSPEIREWLTSAVESGASDVHLVANHTPSLRVHGELVPLGEKSLTGAFLRDALKELCHPQFQSRFEEAKNVDFSFELMIDDQLRRFRVNYFLSRGEVGACLRVIPQSIPDFGWAGFPELVAERLAHFRNGLVLLTGVTGSGKTTTLAMIINLLNQEGGHRIITVEEPIEYLYPKVASSVVTQREVGVDVHTFADGLKYGLRQDPDVILVGEIRDRETAQMALSAAETGHLVLSTMHSRDAKGAISRYADLFPQAVQSEVRSQMSLSLRAVISQHLLPSVAKGDKRELALEIMFNNAPIASAIRFGKIESIDTNILTGRSGGMITLDESIKRLLQANRISREIAERFVSDPSYLP